MKIDQRLRKNGRINFHELKILKRFRFKHFRRRIKLIEITKVSSSKVFSKRNLLPKNLNFFPYQTQLMQCDVFVLKARLRGGGESLYNFFKGRG